MITRKECPLCQHHSYSLLFKTKDYFLSKKDFNINQCEKCGFVFTNPVPAIEQINNYYKSDNYYSHNDKTNSLSAWIYQKVKTMAIKRKFELVSSYVNKKGRLLDYGCGTGELPDYFKKRQWSVCGLEPDDDARKLARKKGLEVYADLNSIIKRDESYDVISLWHVLEHIHDFKSTLKGLISLLSDKNSILLLALPNRKSRDAEKYGKHWAAWDVPRHLYHFSRENVKYLCDETGLELLGVLPMKFDAYYVSLLSEEYLKGRKNYLKALWQGMLSNYKAGRSGEYSSLIYVCRMKS